MGNRKKQLKEQRAALAESIRMTRMVLKKDIENAKTCADPSLAEILAESIVRKNSELQDLIERRDKLDAAIRSLATNRRPSGKKKPGKIHNIAGRSINPTGFTGVVSGGIPSGGKRR